MEVETTFETSLLHKYNYKINEARQNIDNIRSVSRHRQKSQREDRTSF